MINNDILLYIYLGFYARPLGFKRTFYIPSLWTDAMDQSELCTFYTLADF